jgi:hypothetical protein
MITALLSVFLLVSDTPATASGTAPDAPDAGAPKKEKKICKVDPAYTGSRMKKNICLTEAEWDRRAHSGVNSSGRSGRSYTAE